MCLFLQKKLYFLIFFLKKQNKTNHIPASGFLKSLICKQSEENEGVRVSPLPVTYASFIWIIPKTCLVQKIESKLVKEAKCVYCSWVQILIDTVYLI